MAEYENVNYSITNRIATIALSKAKSLNSFNQALRLDLIAALQEAEQDDAVRLIILTGEGRSFCAGADLTEDPELYPSFVEQCEAEYKPFLMAVAESRKLVIAAINGAAAGIGAATAMNCDLIMMAENAYLYQAFSAIGLMPDGGATQLLVHRLGYHKALEMAVDAGKLSAQQCLEIGLANKVVPAEELMTQAQAWAEHLAAGAPLAQASAKQLMRMVRNMSYSEVIDEEAVVQSKLIVSDDAKIGVSSFITKTKPQFTGK